jgi:hypothetical protein
MVVFVDRWKWLVRCTYNETVTHPKVPGDLAIEVGCVDDVTKDIEVEVSEKRGDVVVEAIINPQWRGW